MPDRILILSASAGAGHLRAGEALAAACHELYPLCDTRHIDTLSKMPRPFRRLYGQGYLDFVNHAPELLGLIYDRTNRLPKHPVTDRMRKLAERVNAQSLLKYVLAFDPDVICYTHFLPAEILASQKKRLYELPPQAVVITDFDVHRFWLSPRIDRYFVAREDNRIHLVGLGVAADTIRVTGIPIHPAFTRPLDSEALRCQHQIASEPPCILILCGGFGTGPVESLLQHVLEHNERAQVVVIAGRNEPLRARLARVPHGPGVSLRVLGFTSEMHEWMSLADLVIGKPGGLTTSEALALGLPMVVANSIPGQETRNAVMLYESGVALSGENPWTIGPRVAHLLAHPEQLRAMRQAALALGRPRAAYDVAAELWRIAR